MKYPSRTKMQYRRSRRTTAGTGLRAYSLGWPMPGVAILILAAAALGACDREPLAPVRTPVAAVQIVAPAAELEVGGTMQLSAVTHDRDGRPLPGRTVVWSARETGLVEVTPSGLLTALVAGTVHVRATSEGRIGEVILTVLPEPVGSIQILPEWGQVLELPDSARLTATVRGRDGRELAGRTVTWRSSDTAVARVGPDGVVESRGVGTATISATSGGQTDEVLVRVLSRVRWIDLGTTFRAIRSGESVQLTARVLGERDVPLDRPVVWTSSDPGIVTVDATGLVTGRRPGSVHVSATAEGRTGTIIVSVDTVWTERRLVATGAGVPPVELFTAVRIVDGEPRTVRFEAREGSLRISSPGSRYQLRVSGMLHVEGRPSVETTFSCEGTVGYAMLTGAELYTPDPGAPGTPIQFEAMILPDGGRVLRGRLQPDLPEVSLSFREE